MKYRIVCIGVHDQRPYRAQYKTKLWPFWRNCFGFNCCTDAEMAANLIKLHKQRVIEVPE